MNPRALAILALLIASPAAAKPIEAGTPSNASCGGDAFSSAQVIEGRPPRRGPITAVPDTLCADLAPRTPPVPVQVDVYPRVAPRVGGGGAGVPYGGGRRPDRY